MTDKKDLPNINDAKGPNGVDFNRFSEDFGDLLDQSRAGHYSVTDLGQVDDTTKDVTDLERAMGALSGTERLVWFVIDDAKEPAAT